jgi:hypothetical protein
VTPEASFTQVRVSVRSAICVRAQQIRTILLVATEIALPLSVAKPLQVSTQEPIEMSAETLAEDKPQAMYPNGEIQKSGCCTRTSLDN